MRLATAAADRSFEVLPQRIADPVHVPQSRSKTGGRAAPEKGGNGLTVSVMTVLLVNQPEAEHGVSDNAGRPARGADALRQLIDRRRRLRERSKQADLVGDKELLCCHEAERDPHDRIGCYFCHDTPPY
jgi:hypothetical protein